jgi:hypothetical protein
LNSKNWDETRRSKIGELFQEGMGCDSLSSHDVGLKTPKLCTSGRSSQKSFHFKRDASMKSGTFKLSYGVNEPDLYVKKL